MEDALARLGALGGALGASPTPQQLEQLRGATAAALAAAGPSPSGQHQKRLWEAAAALWNASLDQCIGSGNKDDDAAAPAGADDGAAKVGSSLAALAALRQAACDLCGPVAAAALLPPDQAHLVRFHLKAGQAWASLGELEAAEAVLGRGAEAAAALAPLCFERRGRGPQHQQAASLAFQLLLERLAVALGLGQEMLVGGLLSQAHSFAGDARLPPSEALALRLSLIRLLRDQGRRLAQAAQPERAAPLLSAAYQTLSQVEVPADEGGEQGRLGAEMQGMGAQVLTLLGWCSVDTGEAEQALSCVAALQEMGVAGETGGLSLSLLNLRALLRLGRAAEAEAQLLAIASHDEATADVCLAALRAALAAGPAGVPLARSALSLVLERFAEDPSLAVELVKAALAQAVAATAAAGNSGDSAALPAAVGDGSEASAAAAAGGSSGSGSDASAAAEAVALELVADERLMEGVAEEEGLQAQLHALLWNHAVSRLHSRGAWDAALAFFTAALPLVPGGGESGPRAAECRRSQALCCMGAGQRDRALEFLEQADAAEPGSLLTAMLRLQAHLEGGSADGAAAAVTALATCEAADADALRIAICRCLDAGAEVAARRGLQGLLERYSSGAAEGGPAHEATAFQNLLKLLVDAPVGEGEAAAAERASELAAVFDRLVDRSTAVGAAAFFATDDGRPTRQLEWLALTAWNAGRAAGAAGAVQQAAVLLGACGELYASLPAPSPEALAKQKMALLLAAASAADVCAAQRAEAAAAAADGEAGEGAADGACDGQQAGAAALNLARSYLSKSGAAAAALAAAQAAGAGGEEGAPASTAGAKADVMLLLVDFKLCCLAGDAPAQLACLARCHALPAFGAEHYAMAAALARGGATGDGSTAAAQAPSNGGAAGVEAWRVAEEARLQRLTQQAQVDYAAVAQSLRSLLGLCPSDKERLQLLGEAAGLLQAAAPGAFPSQELRWLVTAAWNRGTVHARFGRAREARSFMGWASAALVHDAGLRGQYEDLMRAELARAQGEGAIEAAA